MKEYENTKEYVGHMEKYVENMKRYVGNTSMRKIYEKKKNFELPRSK